MSDKTSFLNHYFDPILTPQEIALRCGISLATYYRYEKELNVPTLKVGWGHMSGLATRAAIQHTKNHIDVYDLNILRHLGQLLRTRLQIRSGDPHQVLSWVMNNEVSFAAASISFTKERNRTVTFSAPYLEFICPNGVLFGEPARNSSEQANKVLGVVQGSIHDEYALSHFSDRYRVLKFATLTRLYESLVDGKIAAALLYSECGPGLKTANPNITELAESVPYNSYTALPISAQFDYLRTPINLALEQLNDQGLLSPVSFVRSHSK